MVELCILNFSVPGPVIVADPLNIFKLPVKLCTSSDVSPNLVDPESYNIEADTNSV